MPIDSFEPICPRHGHSDQWRSHGWIYVAFVIDAYARRIVGWRVSTSAHAGFVLDALEQAMHDRRTGKGPGLARPSDRGSRYMSLNYTERLAEAGIETSVGSVGDSYDNALAETINGLRKAEVIPVARFRGGGIRNPGMGGLFNSRGLLETTGNSPPAEAEANSYATLETDPMAAQLTKIRLRQTRRGSAKSIGSTPSVLRLGYILGNDGEKQAKARLNVVEKMIRQLWRVQGRCKLNIETVLQRHRSAGNE